MHESADSTNLKCEELRCREQQYEDFRKKKRYHTFAFNVLNHDPNDKPATVPPLKINKSKNIKD